MLTHTNEDVDRDVEKSVRDDTDVEKSVSMHLHTLERPYKRQIVTDTKLRNASHICRGILPLLKISDAAFCENS